MISELSSKNNGVLRKTASKLSGIGNFSEVSVTVKENKENGRNKIFEPVAEISPVGKMFHNRILGSLNDLEAARLLPHLEFISLPSGKELYAAGEFNRYVYFPETTVVSHISDLQNGNTIETAMIGSGGAVGLFPIFGMNPPQHRAQTIIEGTAWRIKTESLKQEFARTGKLQTRLLDYVNRYINQVTQRLVCKSFHLIENRLCSWLLMLHDRVKKDILTLTQEQLALLLGANRPTITIAAQVLRKEGFISYSRGEIKIFDRRGLENFACECYSALRSNE